MIKENFNQKWQFRRGLDNPMMSAFVGPAEGTTEITLPHDAMICSKRCEDNKIEEGIGYFTPENVEYEKYYEAPAEDANKVTYLEFEGVYGNAVLEVNGQVVTRHRFGFTGFVAKISDYLKYGEVNRIKMTALGITFFGVKEKEINAEDLTKLVNKDQTTGNKADKRMSSMEIFKQLAKSKYFYIAALMSVAYYLGNSTGGINVYYARDILGDANLVGIIGLVSIPTMIFGAILAPVLYNKFGKRNIMMVGSVVTIVSTALQFVNPYNMALFLGLYALKGIGIMLFGAGIGTLPGDVADWSEWKIGERAEGIVTSLSSFGSKVGSGLGGALVGWFLFFGHYDGSLEVQAQSALNSEIAMMVGVPMVLAIIQIILLLVWDMDKIRPGILEELENRRSRNRK